MNSLLIAVIYLIFISLGLPDSLLGSGWPVMHVTFSVPSSYAGYVSMTISFMTILSALLSPMMIKRFHTKWIVMIMLTVISTERVIHRYCVLCIFLPFLLEYWFAITWFARSFTITGAAIKKAHIKHQTIIEAKYSFA